MASNDWNSKASRCLKSVGIPSNSALRPHVPRRKIAGPSTRRSLLVKETVARGCRSSYGQIRQNGENRQRPASPAARPTRTECAATSAASADCRSDPAWWKTLASTSSRSAGRKRVPTPCSPPYAALKTCVDPTSSIGELFAPQPPDQKMGCTRVLAVSLQRSEKHASC